MKAEKLFGTDGIRGIPGKYPLTDGMLFKIGRSAAKLLLQKKQSGDASGTKIVIGEDTRISCYQLATVLASGITSCGVDVFLNGVVPTPGLAFLTRDFGADMGLMISASHNLPADNGIKFFSDLGHKLSESEEEWIEDIIFNSLINFNELTAYESGVIQKIKGGRDRYIHFVKSSVPGLNLEGFKIVVDCGYGAVSNYAPHLFRDLGAEVVSIGDQPDGTNINLGCGVLHPENMVETVTRCNADIGLAFDGDGDRLIVSDEQGNILDGDYIMAIIGIHLLKSNGLPKKTIVCTVMTNWGFEQAIENAGGRIIRTDVGDKYILETMRKQGYIFGGEQSGHIICLEHSTTGDALIAALQLLKIMKEEDRRLSQLSQCMCKLPQTIVNVGVRQKKPFDSLPGISQAISSSNDRLKGSGRLLVRYSGTEPVARVMVEGKDYATIKEIANSVADAIRRDLGVEEGTTPANEGNLSKKA